MDAVNASDNDLGYVLIGRVAGKEGDKGKRKVIIKVDKANVRVALMPYIVIGGLINVRPPICYPQVPFQLAFRFFPRVPR